MARPATVDQSRTDRWETRRLAIGGMLALAGAMGIGRFVYTPILPPMAEALDLNSSQAGLIASANYLGYLLGALCSAIPGLPGARRHWLIAGLITSAATTVGMALVSTMPAFLALRFLGGAGGAIVIIFASTLVLERLATAREATLATTHFAGVGTGIVVSAIATSTLLALDGDWRSLWMTTGLIAALFSVAAVLLIPGKSSLDTQSAPTVTHKTEASTSNSRAMWAFIAGYGLFGFGYVVTATFLVAIVRSEPEIRTSEPYIWIVLGLAAIPSVAMWSRLGRRTSTGTAFIVASLVSAAGVISSVLWVSLAGVVVAATLLGGTIMGLTILSIAGVRQYATTGGHQALALASTSFGIGQMIGPAAAGVIANHTGSFTLPTLLAAGALILGAIVVACGTSRLE